MNDEMKMNKFNFRGFKVHTNQVLPNTSCYINSILSFLLPPSFLYSLSPSCRFYNLCIEFRRWREILYSVVGKGNNTCIVTIHPVPNIGYIKVSNLGQWAYTYQIITEYLLSIYFLSWSNSINQIPSSYKLNELTQKNTIIFGVINVKINVYSSTL